MLRRIGTLTAVVVGMLALGCAARTGTAPEVPWEEGAELALTAFRIVPGPDGPRLEADPPLLVVSTGRTASWRIVNTTDAEVEVELGDFRRLDGPTAAAPPFDDPKNLSGRAAAASDTTVLLLRARDVGRYTYAIYLTVGEQTARFNTPEIRIRDPR